MRTVLIPVVVGSRVVGLNCDSTDCSHRKECPQHDTAGDFRSDSGPSPDVVQENNGEYVCYRRLRSDVNGMLAVDNSGQVVCADSEIPDQPPAPLHGDVKRAQIALCLYEAEPTREQWQKLMAEVEALPRRPLHDNLQEVSLERD